MIGHSFNHLWQSTLFAVAAALVTLAFRKNRAHVRYCLWLSASIKFLVPFALLMSLGNSLWSAFAGRQIATKLAPSAVSLRAQQIAQPFTDSLSFAPSTQLTHAADWIPIAIISVWICGFIGMMLVRFRGWSRIRAAMRVSTPIDIQAAVAVRSSPGLLEPGVVGFLRPVLLLPEDILKHLPPHQLEAVIAHELSHVRRRDNLTAAIHMVIEAVFWFHPFVWWIGARLVEERERACDEAVLSLGCEPRDYADAIVNVCKLCVESPLACVSGISGADLKKRIVCIMARDVGLSMGLGRKLLLGTAGLLAVAVPVIVGWGQSTTDGTDWEKIAGGKMSFEVASIRPGIPDKFTLPNFPISNDDAYLNRPNDTFVAGFPLETYIEFAYKMRLTPEQRRAMLANQPEWVSKDAYVVRAKASSNVTKDQMRLMMQSLLANRFKLGVHTETKEMPVFAMVLSKAGVMGPKLIPHAKGPGCDTPLPADGFPYECDSFGMLRMPDHTLMEGSRHTTMSMLATSLTSIPGVQLGRPVVDQTGLNGRYDFTLDWVPEAGGPPAPDGVPGVADNSGPSFTMALQEQLGLKLVPTTAPVKILVIDHVERPTEN